MSTMMEHRSGALAAPDKNYFEQYSEAAGGSRIVGDLLKFSKGEFLAGQDGDEVPEGTRLIASLGGLMVGWIRWEGGKPTDQQMGLVSEGYRPPTRRELGETDEGEWETDETTGRPRDPWQLTNYLVLKEEDGDQLYTFTTSSKGGLGAVARLAGEYGKRLRQKPDEVPVIALAVDSYKHPNKAYGKIFVPKFEVVGWVHRSAVEEAVSADASEQGDGGDLPFDTGGDLDEPAGKAGGKPKAAAGRKSEF